MSSYVENETGTDFGLAIEEIMDRVMEAVLEEEGCPYEAQVNLLITDDEGIREFNRRLREVDLPTDVLSFPMILFEKEADFSVVEEDEADFFDPDSGELMLGDIMISVDKAEEQADLYGHSLERELAFLTAHSMLHLFGYDHMDEAERAVMERKQEEILENRGYTR